MIELNVNRVTKPYAAIPASLNSEGELNAFMAEFKKRYEAPNSLITDITAVATFVSAKKQLKLLRLRGPA